MLLGQKWKPPETGVALIVFFFFWGGGEGEEGREEVMLLGKKATSSPTLMSITTLLNFYYSVTTFSEFLSYIAMLAQAGISQDNNVTIFSSYENLTNCQ